MRGKKFVAWALSAIMAVAPLSACAQQPAGGGEAANQTEEEMDRDAGSTDGETITVDANDEGTYSVTITEDNLREDQGIAEQVDEVVTVEEAGVEEEMTRDAADVAEEAQPAEAAEPAEGAGVSAEAEPAEQADPADEAEPAEQAEPAEWGLASVEREDVVVGYNVPVEAAEGEEPQYETRRAEVTGFSNDGGTIALTFQGEAGAEDLTVRMYTVRFAGTESYAVVHVVPGGGGVVIEDVDFDAQIAALAEYEPGFTMEDISVPEGTHFEDGELVVEEDAPEAVQEALVESGFAEGEMSRADDDDDDASVSSDGGSNATIEYMQRCKETEWDYENYDAVAQYVPEVLSEIDPSVGKVAELGSDAYRIFRGIYRNEWTNVFEGSLGVLKMLGLFKGGSGASGVSNEQILSEIQKVGIEVTEMHCLTKAMKAELNETLRATYEGSLQVFDSSLNSLHANAEVVQNMLTQGAIRAAEDGIEPPAEDCTAEEEFEYNYKLVEYIEKLEATGGYDNSAFKGFTQHAEKLTDGFVQVAGEVADPNRQGPVETYDKYWNLHFNYDTQGYYLRRSYRANIEYELKRAFGLLEVYYNVFAPKTKGNYESYNTLLWKALDRMEGQDAGLSPEIVATYPNDTFPKTVHFNTFDKNIRGIYVEEFTEGNKVPVDLLEEYVERLNGRTLDQDLKLAGLWRNRADGKTNGFQVAFMWDKDTMSNYWSGAHGLGFNGKLKGNNWYADVITYGQPTILEQTATVNNDKAIYHYDDNATKNKPMPVLWFKL